MGPTATDGGSIGDALVARYPAARRFAAVAADSDLDPDDLVQEAFARVIRAARRGERAIDDLDAYLRRTLFHLVANERRSRARRRAALPRVSVMSVVDDAYPSDTASVLDEVAPIDRALVFLVDVERVSTAAAADAVGLSPDATRARLSRARRALRAALSGEDV